jgi:hypothetical protein
VARPITSALVMLGALSALRALMPGASPLAALALQVPAGAAVFAAATFAVWWLAGRPDGPERWLAERARSVRRPAA